ncbi:hypothetical protein [Sorangium sp. So ce1182]|uniref:hypothetical protein n=1 Tax=Sorangium sp. So ce1182 TaxID=3133334 RepID=UPI003F5EEA6A
MNKSLVSSLVVAAAATLSTSAMAFVFDVEKTVEIEYDREDPVDVGTLHCEYPQYFADETIFGHRTEWCQYVCKWINGAELATTTNFYLWEKMKSGFYDCEENSKEPFGTFMTVSPRRQSKGFDFNNHKQKVDAYAAGQTPDGIIYGTISFKGFNFVNYGLTITDDERAEEPEEPEEPETDTDT